MSARCEECGGLPGRGSPSLPAFFLHAPSCSIGQERRRRTALRQLEREAAKRERLEEALEEQRRKIQRAAQAAVDAKATMAATARAAGLTRGRLYKILKP